MKTYDPREKHHPDEIEHQAQVHFAFCGSHPVTGHVYTNEEKQAICDTYKAWSQANDRMDEYERFMDND